MTTTLPQTETQSKIPTDYPGFKDILMGPSGTGKTYAIKTLADAGLEVFALFLEPGLETLIGAYADNNQPIPPNLHWHYLKPKTQGFGSLKTTADMIGKFDLQALAKMKDMHRSQNNQMTAMYEVLSDFPDQRTRTNFGPVDTWGNGTVLVIDSLSALTRMCFDMQVGTKPVRDISDWGIVQQTIMSFIHKLTSGCICHVLIIAHVERETDLILGGNKITVSVPGKAIAATILQPFSDVILASREGDKFFWDTASSQADLKTRNLPIASKLPADFGAIYEKWRIRAELAGS